MDTYDIIAQTIGIIAMALNILSFQQKVQRNIIIMQFFGASLFAVNMFMIGATVGGFLNLLGAFRAIVFANKQKFRADKIIWVHFFNVMYLVSYILTFAVFGKERTLINFIIEFLPIIGMVASGIGFYLSEAKTVRKLGLVSSPSWLVYNICNMAVGGIICEILAMFSIVIGMIRHDRKKK